MVDSRSVKVQEHMKIKYMLCAHLAYKLHRRVHQFKLN